MESLNCRMLQVEQGVLQWRKYRILLNGSFLFFAIRKNFDLSAQELVLLSLKFGIYENAFLAQFIKLQ